MGVVLKLAHPFAPFVSETIWQTLSPKDDSMLITEVWPTQTGFDKKAAERFETVKDIVGEVRQLKTLLALKGGELRFKDSGLISDNDALIKQLARLDKVKKTEDDSGILLTQTDEECYLDIGEKEAGKLADSLKDKADELQKSIDNLKKRLSNPAYINKAPKKLVEETNLSWKKSKASRTKLKDLF